MLLIPCVHCGFRPETEFRCGGAAHILRPEKPGEADADTWADYLYYRANPKGVYAERWVHSHGCGRWFNVLRNTLTDQILDSYAASKPRPDDVQEASS